jgi:hypothetical protein
MLNIADFAKCIRDNLKGRKFSKDNADNIIKDFELRAQAHMRAGKNETDAALISMRETFDRMTVEVQERAKRTAKMLSVQAQNNARVMQALDPKHPIKDKGLAVARAAVSLIESDPRFSGLSYSTNKEIARGQLWALMGDVLDKVGKGAFGRQVGKAHLPNIVREIKGEHTGDIAAKEVADAWLKVSDIGVDMFKGAGGSMTRLARYIPQRLNAARLVKAGEDAFVQAYGAAIDWNKTLWPDGTPIDPANRDHVLREAYKTFTTDGAHKIDADAFRGKGVAVGNQLDNHRFFHFKDADAWLKIHEAYGDGSIFDVMAHHIEGMAHKVALVETFGPNPDATFKNLEAIVKKHAGKLSPKDKVTADNILKNKLGPMMDMVLRSNPMDPHSKLGATVTGIANILTAAQLGSASLLAIPGDFMQTIAVRAFNKMPIFDGMDTYFKTIALDKKFQQRIAAQSGFIIDEAVSAVYGTARFSGVASIGPQLSKRISDGIMRASLMSGHTAAARWTVQSEFMGLLHNMRGEAFDDLPFKAVMERYGITAVEWDEMRTHSGSWSPAKGVEFMKPLDILKSQAKNKEVLFQKFQGMILEEARKGVPESTIEAATTLKGTSRPDTLVGLLLHSFAMYKNFPVSFYMIYGRLGMTSKSVKGKLGFYAGLGAGMTMVGALGTQMREVASGRDPLPMNTPEFWGKAMLSGGAMSIWGDFLFGGVNRMGSSPTETASGPLFGFLGDTTNLLFGDIFKWAKTVGTLNEDFESKTPAKLVEYLKRYTPGTNIWWARLALEREVWDRFQELADPKVYQKRRRKEANQRKQFGNEYWWPAGERQPTRLPHYKGKD